jgi:hypothetical protein
MSLLGAAWKAFCNAKSNKHTLSSNMEFPSPLVVVRKLLGKFGFAIGEASFK